MFTPSNRPTPTRRTEPCWTWPPDQAAAVLLVDDEGCTYDEFEAGADEVSGRYGVDEVAL